MLPQLRVITFLQVERLNDMATTTTEILTAYEFDGETGQAIVRELSVAELAQRQADATQAAVRQAEADAKETTRSSALAKLSALGLTPEEIASL